MVAHRPRPHPGRARRAAGQRGPAQAAAPARVGEQSPGAVVEHLMEPLTVLVADDLSVAALPEGFESSLFATRSIEAACDARRLFVLSSATTLPSVSECI